MRKGLEETRWPGRFTFLMEHPVFLVDGAHNEDAAQKLRMSMERYFPGRRLILILEYLRTRNMKRSHRFFARWHSRFIQLIFRMWSVHCRQKSLQSVQKILSADSGGRKNRGCRGKAMKAAERAGQRTADSEASAADGEPVILACGSLSYLGDVIRLVEKSYGTRTRGTGKEEK